MADEVSGAAAATTTAAQGDTAGTGVVADTSLINQQQQSQPAADPSKQDAGTTNAGEQQAADKKEGESKEGDDKKPPEDKPIEYAEFTLPEGVKVDSEALDQFKAISQEAKIPQDVAQKYVDLYADKLKAAVEAPYKAWGETQEKWVKEINADKDIGGDKLPGTIAAASRAIDRFGGPELRAALDYTGAGNNPAVVRFMANVGKAISEDGPIGAAGDAAVRTTAEVMYPTMGKQE